MSVLVPLQSPFAPVESHRSGQAPIRFRDWHESLIDYKLQHPEWTNKELAAALGRTPVTIGYVTRSDMFKARLAMRREEHNERISFSIIAKTQHIAAKALSQLDEKLEDNAVSKKISARDLGEIASEALSRIGLGPKGPDIVLQTNVQNGNATVMVSSEALLRAQGRLRQNENRLVDESQTREARAVTFSPEVVTDRTVTSPLVIDGIVSEQSRSPILDELMTIGDDVDDQPLEPAAAAPDQREGEG